ncbi:hydrolase [Enterococcus florum]|uniref:Hydrolase n=1 Tax=Enterococcus florum TaxID=2480627 RepID=A0A4P5PL69_9ENTE|nr:Cof-type HAD-IIB family hydrolase [Enterococcus florum]GCF94043.1 hydrolase [Enterococcus florum]
MIKLIAVDMDGTFLNSGNTYDQQRFKQIFKQLKEQDIRFVVASGNQYYQLRSFFPDDYSEIAFVAENGANILIGEQPFYHAVLDPAVILDTLHLLEKLSPLTTIVCGEKSAYASRHISEEIIEPYTFYYHRLKRLEDLYSVVNEPDDLFKIALFFETKEMDQKLQVLQKELQGKLVAVPSGHGDVDLIIPGVHKFRGLQRLGDYWGILPDEMAAFGDSGNDLEMLAHTQYSFAMENARDDIKEAARYQLGSNDTGDLLDILEAIADHTIKEKLAALAH